MRIINSKRKFIARVFDKDIYIDTSDGTGFHLVLEEMKGTMIKFASKSPEPFEDFYQDLCVVLLEGILSYNLSKKTSLSTFLYKIAYNKLIDSYKSKNICFLEEIEISTYSNCIEKIEIHEYTKNWNERWKNIMFRLFVSGEKIKDIAYDENISPWGLTRAVRRKLIEARNLRK